MEINGKKIKNENLTELDLIRYQTGAQQLSDLRESGVIKQDADIVAFLYRPDYYDILEDEEGLSLKGVAEFIVAKNRGGELTTVKLKVELAYTRFTSLEDDFQEALDDMPTPFNPIISRPSKLNDDEDILF